MIQILFILIFAIAFIGIFVNRNKGNNQSTQSLNDAMSQNDEDIEDVRTRHEDGKLFE